MESPTGVIPEELMHGSHKARVIDLLVRQALPAHIKRGYLIGWAVATHTRLTAEDYNTIERSGPAQEPRR